jgi:sterol desaturase/sphingolipid hydroxylase (fatty acid hydroxylase superfamily)
MLENEGPFRLTPFIAVLLTMMAWETWLPRRRRVSDRRRRTFHNLLLAFLDTLALRLVPVLSAVGAAVWAQNSRFGLLNQVAIPLWAASLLTVVAFDLLIYWQHVASHRIPILWQVHKVHHADRDLDASSGLRFHPIEIAFSMGVKCMGAILLGAPPEGVLLFEIVLNGCAVFNHSNVAIPKQVDHLMRWLMVTPDMHRIHHSVVRDETDSNFGFNIPWWDRLFRTYRHAPLGDQRVLELGLPGEPDISCETVTEMLAMPFRKLPQPKSAHAAIARRTRVS